MVASETIAAWRQEIATELAEARAQLADAEVEAESAEAAAPAATAAHDAITKALGILGQRPLATALARRIEDGADEARRAAGRLARARVAVKSLRLRIDDLRTALEQIDTIAPAVNPEAADEHEPDMSEALA